MFDSASPWRRDLIALLRLTGPVAAARLGVMAMGLTDALVVGRYSAVQLGYQALGWTLPAVAMVGAIVLTLYHKPQVRRQVIAEQVARRRTSAIDIVKVKSGQGLS